MGVVTSGCTYPPLPPRANWGGAPRGRSIVPDVVVLRPERITLDDRGQLTPDFLAELALTSDRLFSFAV